MKLKTDITIARDSFSIITQTTVFFVTKPHTSVVPFLFNGRMTPERGFQVYFSTADEGVLQMWHERLCDEVRCGNYRVMMQLAREGQSPVTVPELAQFVIGFKF